MTDPNVNNPTNEFFNGLKSRGTPSAKNLEEFLRLHLEVMSSQTGADSASFFQTATQQTSAIAPEMAAAPETTASRDISVSTKALVMEVLHDVDNNYSVSGYNKRAKQCFGEIYLGLDKGPQYDRQATKVNSAIQSLSAADTFTRSLEATRNKLHADPEAADIDVFVAVLANLCTYWFDIPDGTFVVDGGPRDTVPTPPARCPGDYSIPSACMFYSDGDLLLDGKAQAFGKTLKDQHAKHIAKLRANGDLPKGVLSRAVFQAFSEKEDDLIARTIIGVMMGMLPTVFFNLTFVMGALRAEEGKAFYVLKNALNNHQGCDTYSRAYAVLAQPMMQAMQGKPMPPEVWRTAVKDHSLGSENVKTGDRVIVHIANATAEDLGRGKTDVFPIFGGDRSTRNHPTHACPGYEAAIAIMLGVVNGLIEPT